MSTPHVAGVIALMLSANPALTYSDTFSIITRTAYFQPSWGARPNNNYGWVRVQADAAVNLALHAARVSGTVTAGGGPLAGADVVAVQVSDNSRYNVATDASGSYHLYLSPGLYTIAVARFGYVSQTSAAQSFAAETSTTLN